ALAPHSQAVMLDDLRLQVEKEFPAEFANLYPELVDLPPIRERRSGSRAQPLSSREPELVAAPPPSHDIGTVSSPATVESATGETTSALVRELYEKIGELTVENDRLRAQLRRLGAVP